MGTFSLSRCNDPGCFCQPDVHSVVIRGDNKASPPVTRTTDLRAVGLIRYFGCQSGRAQGDVLRREFDIRHPLILNGETSPVPRLWPDVIRK